MPGPADISIRPFDPEKDTAQIPNIRRMFATGMQEIAGNGFRATYIKNIFSVWLPVHAIQLALSSLKLLSPRASIPFLPRTLFGFVAFNVVAFLIPPVSWFLFWKHHVRGYVQRSLADDLSNIHQHYQVQQDGNSNFWVATTTNEAGEEIIVATCAVEAHYEPLIFHSRSETRLGSSQMLNSSMSTLERRPSSRPTAELRRMSVHPDYRRQGVATRLLTTVMDYARKKGFRTLWLSMTDMQPTAEQFYVKHGFQFVHERKLKQVLGIRYYEMDLVLPAIDMPIN